MKKFSLLVIVFTLMLLAINANATVVTFEDLWPGYQTATYPIPGGYAGFSWSSYVGYITDGYHVGSGYDYGTIGNVSIYTAYESAISMNSVEHFDFNGAYITAAWNNGQDATIEGWRDGALVYSDAITTSYNGPYWFALNYLDIDSLWFKPGNLGTDAGLGGGGHHLCIDNITYNEGGQEPIPEPTTLLLIGSGLLGLVGLRKKVRG